jgi:hypothetical protein
VGGVHAKAATGVEGWQRNSDRAWISYLPADVKELRETLDAEFTACGHPGSQGMPSHCTSYIGKTLQGRPFAYSYRCRSFSRWFNPETRTMEGHSHCTCDSCF